MPSLMAMCEEGFFQCQRCRFIWLPDSADDEKACEETYDGRTLRSCPRCGSPRVRPYAPALPREVLAD
jgi:Zn finger protein HypA/HybF involved in hydrogenase expression